MSDERQEKIEYIANQVINLSRNSLIVNLRFMDCAISMLKPLMINGLETVMVDGTHIGYDPVFILQSYKKAKELTVRQYLHMVLHCVFRHYDVGIEIDRDRWDLASDIAVEGVINELNLKAAEIPQASYQRAEIEDLKKHVKTLTAEVLYRYLKDGNISDKDRDTLKKVFTIDSHDIWYIREGSLTVSFPVAASNSGQSGSADNNSESDSQAYGKQDKGAYNEAQATFDAANSAEDWKKVAEQISMDMETFAQKRGDVAGSMIQNLKSVTREKTDYSEFLRRFAVANEVMKLNDEEFDYIFYTYGLKMYENMPLIEPLEYKEIKQIKEFVIAIDTSGSTSGELVQTFVNKTYNILKQQESFAARINLFIIQCDADIQEAVNITSQEDFDNYLSTFKIKGLGGTDFRPVFQYVDELIEEKKLTNLKGMLYFTDGIGIYPEKAPEYESAFIFIDDEYNDYDVPPWAIKLMLRSEEIEEN